MDTPRVLFTESVFNFRNLSDDRDRPLRQGLMMFRRRFDHRGRSHDWIYTSRNENPDTPIGTNAVVMVTRVHKKALIVNEFRAPIWRPDGKSAREYGFPAGLVEKGENPIVAAVRELNEEVGLKTKYVYPDLTSPNLLSSAGATDETVKLVFLDAEGEIHYRNNESSESIYAELMDFSEILGLMSREDILFASKAWQTMWGWWMSGGIHFHPVGQAPPYRIRVKWENNHFHFEDSDGIMVRL